MNKLVRKSVVKLKKEFDKLS